MSWFVIILLNLVFTLIQDAKVCYEGLPRGLYGRCFLPNSWIYMSKNIWKHVFWILRYFYSSQGNLILWQCYLEVIETGFVCLFAFVLFCFVLFLFFYTVRNGWCWKILFVEWRKWNRLKIDLIFVFVDECVWFNIRYRMSYLSIADEAIQLYL